MWATQQVRALRPSDSEEEMCSLPDSDDIDSEGNGSNNNHSQELMQHSDASADEQALFTDTPRDDVEMDHPDNNMSGKSCPDHVRFNSIVLTVLHSTIRGHGERYPYPIQWFKHFYSRSVTDSNDQWPTDKSDIYATHCSIIYASKGPSEATTTCQAASPWKGDLVHWNSRERE